MVYSNTASGSYYDRQQYHGVSRDRDAAVKSRPILSAGVMGAILLACVLSAAAVLTPGRARALATASAAVIGGDPTATVKAVIDEATTAVRDTEAPANARDKRLREIAEANFDFSDMARTTLGYHWRQLSPQQQAEFVPLFTTFMENVYLSKMQEYSVQKLRQTAASSNVTFTGQRYDGADYAEVHSTVLLKDQPQPIKVDYLVRRDGTSWKIYDLEIDAISVMANYRQQFNRVLNNDGYPALVDMLRKKVQQLGSTLGK